MWWDQVEQMGLLSSFHKTGGVIMKTLKRASESSWNVFYYYTGYLNFVNEIIWKKI